MAITMRPSAVYVTLLAALHWHMQHTFAAKILAILTTPTRSHHIWNTPLMHALASRGHQLTIVSPLAQNVPVPNITDIVLEGSLEFTSTESDYHSMVHYGPIDWIPGAFDWYKASCTYSLSSKGGKTLMEYTKNTTFDLIIIEASGGECFLGFIQKFGSPPVMAINGFGNPQWINYNNGNPDNPSYVSSSFLTYSHPMSFFQRLKNTIIHVYSMYYYYNIYLPSQDALIRQHFGSGIPPVTEILKNMSVVLVSSHPSIDGPRPMIPNMIEVGGIHIKRPKPLPKDLQTYLDEAKDGVIYFSLGSIVRSDRMTADNIQAFLDAFAELPQKVLWKWESDSLPGQPKNVKVGKWLPQNDILAHPNVRLFISHSGLLSTHETIHRGVPVVGMPFIVDQYLNIHRMENLGVGERLDYATLSKESILKTLHKVLDDPKYHDNMKRLSKQFRDHLESPLERAVYWTEYVLRHQGAKHLRAPALDLAWYQYLLLDIVVFILAAVIALLLSLCLILRTIRRVFLHTDKVKKQ